MSIQYTTKITGGDPAVNLRRKSKLAINNGETREYIITSDADIFLASLNVFGSGNFDVVIENTPTFEPATTPKTVFSNTAVATSLEIDELKKYVCYFDQLIIKITNNAAGQDFEVFIQAYGGQDIPFRKS